MTLAILFFMFVGIALGVCKINIDTDAQRLYAQGMEFYKDYNYSDAYYNFKQVNRFARLYELSLLKQFQCANYLADKKTASIKLEELIKIVKNPYLRPYLLYSEANIAQNQETLSEAQILSKYRHIYDTFKDSDYAIASAYKIAKFEAREEKSAQKAKEKFIEYLSYAPNGKFALQALEELSNLDVNFLSEDYEAMGRAYYINKEYAKALKYYKKTLFSRNWVKIAKCYNSLNDFSSEQNTIISGLNLKASDVDEKEIDYAIDRLIAINKAGKIQTLQDLYEKYPHSYATATIAYKLAEASTSVRALNLYEFVLNKYPSSIWASNCLWEMFWYNYKYERYKVCEQLAQTHSDLYSNTQDAPRVAYWHAKALLNERKNQQAKEVLYKVINTYPLSYYAFLSTKQLKSSKADKFIIKKPISDYNINAINKYLFKDKVLLYLANYDDFQTIDELKINDAYIKSWIANKKKNYPLSIKIAKDEMAKNEEPVDFSNPAFKLIYPILYNEEINFYAYENKLSPYLYMSLVREESHFDKNAKSAVGALGLAQLMPATANFTERKTVSKETLLNADENIKIGTKYFSYLVDYFNDNEYLAILAYNAGPGNVTKWINDSSIRTDDIDSFVEDIPYLETKNYIKKILSTYFVYARVYSPKNR